MSVRILIADDHKIMRDGLRSLLEKNAGYEVIGEAEDGRTAVKLTKELSPDVVIMDISMPDLNGIEATVQIMKDQEMVKVIGLSMHSDRRFVARMLQSGASGYLLKDCAFEELAAAVRTVMDNQVYLSPQITDMLVKEVIRGRSTDSSLSRLLLLSLREREVLQLITEGKSTKQIAAALNLSVKTVETHRQNIMKKLEIKNLVDLTKFAIREGLTSLES